MIAQETYKLLEPFGIDRIEVDKQYQLLTQGAKFINLESAATVDNGIKSLSKEEASSFADYYNANCDLINIQKFVPASGAATRMFKELSEFELTGIESETILNLFNAFDKLAFAPLIPTNLSRPEIASYILKELGYKSTPKGLIPFHKYKGFTRTPFKEHWIEGLNYASSNGKVKMHFTISVEHQEAFEKIYQTRIKSFSEEYKLNLEIEFSQQHKSTDTIVADGNNEILLDNDGDPVLRPGGHGALIQNLNSLKADLVFIKNIDNITHQNHSEATTLYKKALAGFLLKIKNLIFNQLEAIDRNEFSIGELENLGNEIQIIKPNEYHSWNEDLKINFWTSTFNRPIRACGMVKNEGEPGGGPFWTKDTDKTSLQIVETAQVNMDDLKQAEILKSSTHFNPVDLVCYLTDFKGNKFNLLDFIDESTAFITSKTVLGKDVNVLERPGLWNGAMANWTTLFVEVPIETFNPVKTINDLLKPAHLP